MNLYQDKSSYAKPNAQQNLEGRTHYVDDGTLRFHHARILAAKPICKGLLFYVIESTALDMHNTKRGFRGVVFDLFGNVITRARLEDCLSTRKAAERAMWKEIDGMNAVVLNLAALKRAKEWQTKEWERMETEIKAAS